MKNILVCNCEVLYMGMPSGRYLFGTVKVGELGQIIIPKEARETFGIKAGDTLIVMGDENWGIAVTKADILEQHTNNVFQKISSSSRNEND